MTVTVANTANNNTFDYWRNRTNEIAYALSTYAVTAGGSNAAVGDATITGIFTSNNLTTNTANIVSSVVIGNSTISTANTARVNSSYIAVGNTITNTIITPSAVNTSATYIGSNLSTNTTTFWVGPTTSNAYLNKTNLVINSPTSNIVVNAASIYLSNNDSQALLTPLDLTIGNSIVNTTIITTGAGGLIANTTAVKVGSNVYVNTSTVFVSNSLTNVVINTTSFALGNSVNTTINSSSMSSYNVYLGSNVIANTSTLFIGNSTIYSVTNSTVTAMGNSSVNTTINSSSIATTWGFYANDTGIIVPGLITGTINTPAIAFGTGTTNTVINTTSFVASNSTANTTVTALTISTRGSLSVANAIIELGLAGSGYANVKNDLFVRGNLVVNGSLTYTGNAVGDLIPSTDSVYSLGNTSNKWFNIVANTLYISNNATVNNNLTVTTSLTVGGGTGNSFVNSTALNVNGYLIANSTGAYGIGTVNAVSYTIGSSSVSNSSGIFIANTTGTVNTATFSVGTAFTANSTLVNAVAINVVNQVNTATLYAITSANIASAFLANSTGAYHTGTINAASYTVGTTFVANSSFVNAVALNVVNTLNVGGTATNVSANSTSIKIANSTTSITIVNPTTSQIAQGNTFLNANGSWAALPTIPIYNAAITTTGTSTQLIDSYSVVTGFGAEYVVHVFDNNANNRTMSKLLTVHDRGNAYVTEYAQLVTNNVLGIFSANIAANLTHVVLNFTPAGAYTNTTVRFFRTAL